MPADSSPRIFVSATSRDLRSVRQRVNGALLTLGCTPVEQSNFPPDSRSVRDMLRARLKDCQAVIHLAGHVYGSEPTQRAPGEPRRSYTQLEVDIARELRIPVYIFICAEGFPYDAHDPEPDELRQLQLAHRAALTSTDSLFETVADAAALEKRVLTLQERVERLRDDLARAKRRLWWAIGVSAAGLGALAISLWWVDQRSSEARSDVKRLNDVMNKVGSELEKQRRIIHFCADAFTRMQSELVALGLTPDELRLRVISEVAKQENVDPVALRSGIERFVAAVSSDLNAMFLDRALADFVKEDFASAADNAGKAAVQAQAKRVAAQSLARHAPNEAQDDLVAEQRARRLQGQSFYAAQNYIDAVIAFELALDVTPRADSRDRWAELQFWLASAANRSADRADGVERAQLRSKAISAYRAALEVYTRADQPQDWAMTQNNLGTALSDQASASPDSERARLLGEAVSAYRAALEIRTRADRPDEWADTQISIALALLGQTTANSNTDRGRLLGEAVAAYRAALEVRTRVSRPQDWARGQLMIALMSRYRATLFRGPNRARLVGEAASAYRAALEVYTRADQPRQWAATQDNLGVALRDQASAAPAEGGERARLLGEAVSAYRAALEVRTRADLPREWSETQDNLGHVLRDQANGATGPERLRLLREAAAAMRSALELYGDFFGPESLPPRRKWLEEVEAQIRALENP